jgi:hypothetical protein
VTGLRSDSHSGATARSSTEFLHPSKVDNLSIEPSLPQSNPHSRLSGAVAVAGTQPPERAERLLASARQAFDTGPRPHHHRGRRRRPSSRPRSLQWYSREQQVTTPARTAEEQADATPLSRVGELGHRPVEVSCRPVPPPAARLHGQQLDSCPKDFPASLPIYCHQKRNYANGKRNLHVL